MFDMPAKEHLQFSAEWNRTGWSPLAHGYQSWMRGKARLSAAGGPIDAPDFIPVGCAQCPMTVDTFPRGET